MFNSISNNDPLEPSSEIKREALQFDSFNVVSGIPVAFTINITDSNRVLLVQENSARASIDVVRTEPGKVASVHNNRAFSQNGVLNFTGLEVVAEPGYPIQLELSIDLSSEIDGTRYFEQNQVIEVQVRKCLAGEQFTAEGKCEVCPPGTYLLVAPSYPMQCKPCEPESFCLGGNQIAPQAAYWRPDAQLVNFIECLNPEACLAGDEQHLTSNCAEPYDGPLCSQCTGNYY